MKKDSFNHPRKYNILAVELLSQREKKGWQDKAQSFLTPQRLQTFGATASVVVVVRRNGSCHRRRSSTVVVGPRPLRTKYNKVCYITIVTTAVCQLRDNSLELLQPMTANPISFEFSLILRYVTSKEIRQTVLQTRPSETRENSNEIGLAVMDCNSS